MCFVFEVFIVFRFVERFISFCERKRGRLCFLGVRSVEGFIEEVVFGWVLNNK